jgi:hypothetical protein
VNEGDSLRSQIGDKFLRHGQLHLIDEAPGPFLARLEGSHHRVVSLVKVLCGVTAGRAVTTSDVTASETKPKMDPRRTVFQALFTSVCPGGSRNEPLQVMTTHNGPREE